MGSIDSTLSINFDVFGDKIVPETTTEQIVETIWAITHFVYTSENSVNFLCYSGDISSYRDGTPECLLPGSIRGYLVGQDMNPAQIAKGANEIQYSTGKARELLRDTSAPSFLQLIKQTQLVVVRGSAMMNGEYELRNHSTDSMTFYVSIGPGFVKGTLRPSDTQHHEYMTGIADTIGKVAEQVINNWNSPLEQLNFLGPRNWNELSMNAITPIEVGNNVMCDILVQQNQLRPSRTAVEAWDGKLTYAELYGYSRQMAVLLMNNGAEPGENIGMCMKKSKWALVTIWGILIAGCSCVPLDIRNPKLRNDTLLKRVGARYVVADQQTIPRLDGLDTAIIQCNQDVLENIDASQPTIYWPQVSPFTVAFVMFTSGTTGLPKAVLVEHGPLYGSIKEISREFFLEETSKLFQFSPYIFDGSTGDIFATMLAGGCLCVPSEEDRLDNLPVAIRKSKATHIFLTNTVISQLQPADVPDLRYLVSGGEAASHENFIRWRDHVHMKVGYGITESIIFSIWASPEHLLTDSRIIGWASGNCVWVVDPTDPENLKPVGAVGEIIIEGPLLARGYLGDPKRTADKFIPSPSWLRKFRADHTNYRCYRSGDHGIRNADGSFLYLGRADTQVKIRGQRVELGEIESSLLRAEPSLGKVAVEAVKLTSRDNEQALAAFVKRPYENNDSSTHVLPIDEESKKTFQAVRSKLLESSPRYMVPSLFIPIRDIPQSATGKRDRNTLKAWAAALTEEHVSKYQLRDVSSSRPPETPEEELLQKLWAKVLQVTELSLGPEDNFFEAGGDSIKAIQLVAELREHGRLTSVSRIFEVPEMEGMARLLGYIDRETSQMPPKPFELLPHPVTKEDVMREAALICQVDVQIIEDIYPTAPMQEALMAISAHQLNVYTIREIFRVPDSLDMDRFQEAWEILASSQPILRTRIVTLPSVGTVQVVLNSKLAWHKDMTLHEFIEYDESTPFAYGSPLSRHAAVKDDKGSRYFAWSCHHAITDGWTRPAMFDEIRHIYRHGYAHPQVLYTPFIQYILGLDLEKSDKFWKDQFLDTTDSFPRLPDPTYMPHAQQLQTLDVKLNRQAASKITTSTLVQAAWALVTATYANTDEAVFGLTLSGRDAPVSQVSSIMGITIATVPVRIILGNENTVSKFLEDTQKYIWQIRQHQHVGLQHISRLSSGTRSAAGFQNLLVIQPTDDDQQLESFTDMGLELVDKQETDTNDHVLTVQCEIHGDNGSLHVKAHYDSNVITDQQMECILHYFDHVIKQLATESTTLPLSHVDRISHHDRNLLAVWNGQMPPAMESTLHGLFEKRVHSRPDALALDGFGGQMTYAELDSISSQLARFIGRKAGVGSEARVALCFTPSKMPVIAMLATLKSGGVCVSINPDHPTTRLVELIGDVEACAVLCDEGSVSRLTGHGVHVIGVTESLLASLDSETTQEPVFSVLPSNASFVVFTSGSTGKPKGTILEHRSLATCLTAVGKRAGLNSQSRTLQFSSYTFDVSILEIFGTLINGGCLCVISSEERLNRLTEVINERRANFAVLTKTVSRLLEPENVPTLKTLILTGERNGRQDYLRWASNLRLFNGMAPSECTPLAILTRGPVAQEDDPANIGHSMACQLWVTQRGNPDRLAPIGSIGELIIEGHIVGRGYVNRPNETAAAFVQNLAWSQDGSGLSRRFYRTGDLAKMNTDGSIIYMGRTDDQIKINGQRVELGEIEDQLRRCSSNFSLIAVDTFQNSSGADILVVFCSRNSEGRSRLDGSYEDTPILPMDDETRASFRKLQAELSTVLPRYMVPSTFFPVEYIPFNASGKLERKKLRAWVANMDATELRQYYLASQSVSRAPRTDMEKRFQALWAKVLNMPVESIHAEENFFRLGGDSVSAMKLAAEARAEGIPIIVADIFRLPVLENMALAIENAVKSNGWNGNNDTAVEPMSLIKDKIAREACIRETAEDCRINADLIEDIYPCNPTQEALMAVSSHQSKAYTFQSVMKLPESMDLNRFKLAWERLVAKHAIYRTRIVYRSGIGSLQVVLRSNITWHTISDMSPEEYIRQKGDLFVEYGSELCKFAIVQHGNRTTFVGTWHHALYDGWSLMRTYEEFSNIFQNSDLQKPIIPYANFFRYLSTIEENVSDEFWRAQFPNAVKTFPQLRSSQYVPQPRHSKSSTIHFGRKPGSEVTLATVIQTAWSVLMSKYSETDETVFGLMLSGRDAPVDGIADIVGPTVVMVPLRFKLDQDMSVAELLKNMQTQTAEIRQYQNAGLQRIRRLSPEANTACDFQNLLVVQTMDFSEITAPLSSLGLQVADSNTDEFLDLALTVDCTIKLDSLHVRINFDDNVVPDRQVDFMLHQLEHIASILVEGSNETKLRDITLVSPYDLKHLSKWNRKAPEPVSEAVPDLFEAQARNTPSALAISGFDGDFTYKELDTAANKLAAYLNFLGVGPEKCVLLCLKKSVLAIISFLAVLKSGGVCVPVNPDHPLRRRLDICEEVEAVTILCDAELESELSGHAPHVISVEPQLFTEKLDQYLSTWSRLEVHPSSAAFILYTSGSTGKPKGCILEHHSVCFSWRTYAATTKVTAATRTLQFASYSFDVATLDMFGTWVHGGCLCVISEEERMNDLVGAINARSVTRLNITNTVAGLIEPAKVPTVDTIFLLGEPLTQKVLKSWSAAKGVWMIEHFAPTESSNLGTVNFEVGIQKDPTNIGRAYGWGGAWIVERDNPDQLCPVGCIGEILLESSALGRGYLKRLEATAAAFIEDPVWSQSTSELSQHRRFYRTGDTAFYTPEGSIKFIGRVDNQVKINGQRVELREVEYQIDQSLPTGSEVVVDIVNLGTSPTLTSFIKLPTFVIGESGLSIEDIEQLGIFRAIVEELEKTLPDSLPHYMIPSAFVPVSFIPMLASAKIDRKQMRQFAESLSSVAILSSGASAIKQQPTNNTEATLQLIWSQILGKRPSDIGIGDTFMGLGGDSITAMQVVSECRKVGIVLQVSTILRKKTISSIAPLCKMKSFESSSISIAEDGVLFDLSPIQKLYFEQELGSQSRFNQSFFVRVKSKVSTEDLQRAFDAIVQRHAMLRTRFSRQENSDQWKQYASPETSESYRFRSHNLTRADEVEPGETETCITARVQESLSAMDITAGPVFSVDYFNIDGDDNMMYMVAHHLVIDLVSWRIIWGDLEEIVRKGSLPSDWSSPFTFQNWVSLQEQTFKSGKISPATVYPISIPKSQFDYWGVPQQDNVVQHTTEQSFSLSAGNSSLLLGKGNQAMRTTPLDIMTGLLMHSFHQIFVERSGPSIFIEHHGREPCYGAEDVDLTQTVGWFTTMHPVYVPVNQATSPSETIRLVKDTRSLIPRNGHPYFAYRHLSPEGAEFAHHTPAEILINFSGIFQQLESQDSLLQLESRVAVPEETNSTSHRSAMIDIEVSVSHNIVQFLFQIHKDIAHKERVQKWISIFQDSLIKNLPLLEAETPMYTLSDFPHLKLSFEDLVDLITNKLPETGLNTGHGIIEDIYPCTAMQEGILLSQQSDSTVYQFHHIFEFTNDARLKHNLPSRLSQAWKSVVERHTALRTGIIEHATDHGHFVQIVLGNILPSRFVEVEETFQDISKITYFGDDNEGSFWTHVPRLVLYHLKDGRYACDLQLSHALMDGMSRDILIDDLICLLTNQTLSSPPLEFGMYVEYEQNENPSQNVTYWTDYLDNLQPCHIPTNNHRELLQPMQDYDYIKLPEDTTKGLEAFCQHFGVTQAVTIQTAWAIVLSTFTSQDEVCFGYLASGRDAPLNGIENSVGLLISMQVCRVRIEGTVGDLVQNVYRDVIAGLDHRNCSLALIQSKLGLNSTPLFNTCMTIRRAVEDAAKTRLSSLIKEFDGAERTEYAIALDASVGQSAEIGMSYQTSKIPLQYAKSIAGSLETVLRSLLKPENKPVDAVELIADDDRRLVEEWNSPPPEMVHTTLHGLVKDQVQANPNAIATTSSDGEYTYAQFYAIAKQLAFLLTTQGVGPEVKVVLCFAKSTWPIISMLAVLVAGGACVSTNPDHPTTRLLDICKDVETTVVLCDEQNAARFQDHIPSVLTVNEGLFTGLDIPADWVPPPVQPNNAAFVVYTSGSTGKPKGVVLEHHSVSKSQLINAKAMNITSTTRAAQFAAYTFDASICEIFAPLVVGGCVCVITDDERMDDLSVAINARKANWIMLTPTVAQILPPSAVPTLTTLVFGGEALSRQVLSMWYGHVHLVNYWGPSECANSGCINTDIRIDTDPMNIGRASGHNIWITEQKNPHRLAPIGCPGEIVVEGPMLGRGYINRPEATAQAFVKDLAWSKDLSGRTRRFYRTGDLGRLNADRSVTFVGRADNQVKIRGQRVELDEIKHQIFVNLPVGSEVVIDVVSIGGDQNNKKTLAAFIKLPIFSRDATHGTDIGVKDIAKQQEFRTLVKGLEKSISEILPQYMMPSAYIPVSQVPLTPSAKTDRLRLREHAKSLNKEEIFTRNVDSEKKQPTTEMERDLQTIWAQVLNHPTSMIGIDDTFMSLGGDSITAMHAVAQCRKIGIKLPVSLILQKKTIAAISSHCERMHTDLAMSKIPHAQDGTPFGLSPIQKRYFEQESSRGWSRYNMAHLCRVTLGTTAQQLRQAFDLIVARHGMLRARFHENGHAGWHQSTTPFGSDTYRFSSHDIADLSGDFSGQIEKSQRALDIVSGPVFSVDFFSIPDQDGVLFMAAHHLVVDIVSWQIILGDLEEIIQSGKLQGPSNISFHQWCDAQEREAKTKSAAEEVLPLVVPPSNFNYWQVPLTENIFGDTLLEAFELPRSTTDLILNASNHAMGTTPLEILIGPLLSSFSQVFTDRDVPSVFIEQHGREAYGDDDIGSSQVVGWFTALYPLHATINKSTTAAEAIRLVKDLRRRVPHNGQPYFAYRHLTASGEEAFSHHDPVEIVVNFTGIFQQLESSGSVIQLETRIQPTITDVDPSTRRWAMIDVEIGVSRGVMTVQFLLNQRMAQLDSVQQWIKNYKAVLSQTAESLAVQKMEYTLSDFPLLDMSYNELGSLFSNTLPRVGLGSTENIEDICPLSPFQRYSVEGHLETTSKHWNQYYFDMPQDVDTDRLRQTCLKLVQHYSILRTIFLQHNDVWLQIVLKSLEPQIDVVESEGDISVLVEDLFQADLSILPSPGKAFLRFIILRTPTHTRLLMRLSHAQFDGFSRISFIQAFGALYSDKTPPQSVDYSRFMTYIKQRHQTGCKYWRSVLDGAEPTTVINTIRQPLLVDRGTIRLERDLPAFQSLESVTSATVFNTACALVVQSLTNSFDITFGRVTSARAALDPEYQNLVGPCANIIPVRVRFQDGFSIPDVLQQVHKQYLETIPYETVGMDDIIRDCTQWSTSMAKFPVIVQHHNLEEGSEAHMSQSDKVDMHLWEAEDIDSSPWSLCLSAHPSRTGTKVLVSANSKYVEHTVVEDILNLLCSTIDKIFQS